MIVYAVIDTNVLVSALLKCNSTPWKVIQEAINGRIIPIINAEILEEYREVLNRPKFPFGAEQIHTLLEEFEKRSVKIAAASIEEEFPDPDDAVFYEVTMETRKEHDAYLVTGNLKHFPETPFIVTPSEILQILETA